MGFRQSVGSFESRARGVIQFQRAGRRGSSDEAKPVLPGTAQAKTEAGANNYLSGLEKRVYLRPGGAPRDHWRVVYGRTTSEAWDNADELAGELGSFSTLDDEVKQIAEVAKSVTNQKIENVRKRAKEIVELRLKGISGLPPDTKLRAKSDAVILASLHELSALGVKNLQRAFELMEDADEIWKSGFGRYGIAGGKQIVYGVKDTASGNGSVDSATFAPASELLRPTSP